MYNINVKEKELEDFKSENAYVIKMVETKLLIAAKVARKMLISAVSFAPTMNVTIEDLRSSMEYRFSKVIRESFENMDESFINNLRMVVTPSDDQLQMIADMCNARGGMLRGRERGMYSMYGAQGSVIDELGTGSFSDADLFEVDYYGLVDRSGPAWRERVIDEVNDKARMNEILDTKVFDLDKLVYVSTVTMEAKHFIELDALLIRYMSTMPKEELETLLNAVAMLVVDRVIKTFIAECTVRPVLINKMLGDSSFNNRIGTREVYLVLVADKLISNSCNNVVDALNDTKSVNQILTLAKLRLHEGGFNALSRASVALTNIINRSNIGRPLVIDRLLENATKEDSNKIQSIIRKYNEKHFGGDVSFRTYGAGRAILSRIGSEEIDMDIVGRINKMVAATEVYYKELDNEMALYSFMGTENVTNERELQLQRKRRSELLLTLSYKEKKIFTDLEADIVKFKSDTINCADNFKRNMLLNRSKGLTKIMNMEIARSKSENLTELLVWLEEEKYSVDQTLMTTDYNKKKDSEAFAQYGRKGVSAFDY